MKKILILGIVAFMLQSCATIINGSKQEVTFNSDPPDATVYFYKYKNKYEIHELNKSKAVSMGKTPMTLKIKRNTPLIFISKQGYQDTILYCKKPAYYLKFADPKTGLVTSHLYRTGKYMPKQNWWYFGNIIFGGVYGMCIDYLTGAHIRLDKEMKVKLERTK